MAAAIESYGRLYRLVQAHVPVTMQMDVDTMLTGDHEHAFNTIAEMLPCKPLPDPDAEQKRREPAAKTCQ